MNSLGQPLRSVWRWLDRVAGGGARRDAAARRLFNDAQTLHRQDRLAEAEQAYTQLLAIAPRHAAALHLVGVLQTQRQNYAASVDFISRALHIEPAIGMAWYDLAIALARLTRYDEAVACYDRAAGLVPDQAKVWKDRGAALRRLTRLPEALDSYEEALALRPDYIEALIGRGTTLHDMMRVPEALASFERALALRPGDGKIHQNRGFCRLLLGDFAGGWADFELRHKYEPDAAKKTLGLGTRWDGTQPLDGKSILLWAEPGLGETVQFCRFAKPIAELGAHVLLMVLRGGEARALDPVMQGVEGIGRVLRADELAPKTDYHCPLRSLPLALRTDLGNLPAARQYLHADPARVAAWGARLGPRRLPRIGLVWSGGPGNHNDHNRSIPLPRFMQLVHGPFEFVCLQKEVREADKVVLEQRPDIRRFCDDLTDFGETAALIQHLDMVISVDTSVAHLAAALGRPVWILLTFAADWRWLLDRTDTPWYPTARLFRQKTLGDWEGVFAAVQRALTATTFPVAGPEMQDEASNTGRAAS